MCQFYASVAKMPRLSSLFACVCVCVVCASLVRCARRRDKVSNSFTSTSSKSQKDIKEMRISLSPIDRRWKETGALGRHLAILARINWSLILFASYSSRRMYTNDVVMLVKDERTMIALSHIERVEERCFNFCTYKRTHTFFSFRALRRLYFYVFFHMFITLSISTEKKKYCLARTRDMMKQRYGNSREGQKNSRMLLLVGRRSNPMSVSPVPLKRE